MCVCAGTCACVHAHIYTLGKNKMREHCKIISEITFSLLSGDQAILKNNGKLCVSNINDYMETKNKKINNG